jgi:FlaA1/EpsC-like NDP-sugar epimerase
MKEKFKDSLIFLKSINILPSWLILLFDFIIITFIVGLSYYIYNNLGVNLKTDATALQRYLILITVYLLSFLIFKTYKGILRYSSLRDIIKIFKAVLLSTAIMIFINELSRNIFSKNIFIYSILVNGTFFGFFALIGFRIVVKSFFQFLHRDEFPKSEKENIAIIGVNSQNISLIEPLNSMTSKYNLICFIDKNNSLNGKKVSGVIVHSGKPNIITVLRYKKIKNLILHEGFLEELEEKKLIEDCIHNGIKVYKPELLQNTKNSQSTKLKEYNLEELLFRNKIDIDNPKVIDQYKNKTIMVTGGAGSIGSELAKQIAGFKPKKIIVVDNSETPLHDIQLYFDKNLTNCSCFFELIDVTNKKEVKLLFKTHQPDIVFHAAAYKHVPVLEKNHKQAIKVNVFGTLNCLENAVKQGTKKFIFVSTDKAVNPTNIMGSSKRIAEIIAQNTYQSLDNNSMEIMITRFGNVLGSNGSVVHLFKEQIAQGGPITVTHPEVNRFFMTIPEACKLVIEAGAMGNGGNIYVFDMGKSIKIVDLADKMIRLAGKIPGKDIEIKFTGLRPGEKLYEEVLTECSETLPTYHPKIVIAKESDVRKFSNSEIIALLEDFQHKTRKDMISIIKNLVPEYQPENRED